MGVGEGSGVRKRERGCYIVALNRGFISHKNMFRFSSPPASTSFMGVNIPIMYQVKVKVVVIYQTLLGFGDPDSYSFRLGQ